MVDGAAVAFTTPASTAYGDYTTNNFTVSGGNHRLTFAGLDPTGGDKTAFIDNVSVQSLASVANAGFEAPAVGAGVWGAFQYGPAGAGWTFSGAAGVTGNGSGFTSGAPNAPQGGQVAFIQQYGRVSQSVLFPVGGTYTVGFQATQRVNGQASYQEIEVLIDGSTTVSSPGRYSVQVGICVPFSFGYNGYTTGSFTVPAGAHTLTFQGLDPLGGDNTAFIDQVQVNNLDWFGQNLQDPGIRAVARSLFTCDNGSLRHKDMIQILGEAAAEVGPSGRITSTQFLDLQTLIGNAPLLGMADDVRVLANKVVKGDAANFYYQGAPLGNLFSKTGGLGTGDHLLKLVNKWFLGTDHPQLDPSLSYLPASGSLFATGGPVYQDVNQGNLGDCWLMAPLAETAFREPWLIQGMFTDNGDGTYSVRFYNNGFADYVTVDNMLPFNSGGGFVYANEGQGSYNWATNILWVALAEKAYAQLSEAGWDGCPAVNAYSSIDVGGGFAGPVLQQITGRPTHQVPGWLGVLEGDNWLTGTHSAQDLINSFQNGNLITLDSNLAEATGNGIVPQHVYALVGYDAATQTFTLYNPWGVGGGTDDQGNAIAGILHLTWSQVQADFFDWHEVGP
jgi:hypothetical protein